MQWYGILAFFFMLSVLAGIVYVGANTEKLGFDFGEPTQVIRESSFEPSSSSSDIQTTQTTEKLDLCSNIDAYCMDKYGMSNPNGYNSCVKTQMYRCNPELKTAQWDENTCDRLEQKLIEIRTKKSMIPSTQVQSAAFQDLLRQEYDVDQDLLNHCN